jgi:hypothetical protein
LGLGSGSVGRRVDLRHLLLLFLNAVGILNGNQGFGSLRLAIFVLGRRFFLRRLLFLFLVYFFVLFVLFEGNAILAARTVLAFAAAVVGTLFLVLSFIVGGRFLASCPPPCLLL